MRNLIQFLKKFRDFLIFIALQVFVLSLFFNNKNYHRSAFTNTSSGVIGWFVEKKHNITQHFGLAEANEKLAAENAALRAQLPHSFYNLQNDIFFVNDSIRKQRYKYTAAKVINSSYTKRTNYYTLDKGSAQGIRIGMGVVSSQGAIGVVTDVSNHFAVVMSLLSDNSRTNVKLKKNNEYWFLTWDGKDSEYGQIPKVKRDIDVEVGDVVVTRGSAGQFPEGIPVGTVSEIISEDGEQTISLNIKLTVNYNAVYDVYVVENMMLNEQTELENRVLDNE